MAAGLTTLRICQRDADRIYPQLNHYTETLCARMSQLAQR